MQLEVLVLVDIGFCFLVKYFIRDVLDLEAVRLDERFMDNLQTAFIPFQRTDGNLIDGGTHPTKYYQNSAT